MENWKAQWIWYPEAEYELLLLTPVRESILLPYKAYKRKP